ncbi:MAG: HEAT repeat domain-containing protein [Bryobacteraceae bacterium]
MKTVTLTIAFVVMSFGQGSQPVVTHAAFESRAFSGNLPDAIRSGSAHWFGYAVKATPRGGGGCCWANGTGYGCGLEGRSSTANDAHTKPNPIELEGPSEIGVFFRFENGTVGKVQVYSLQCPLDAGGLPFTWLTGVPTDASLRYLETLLSSSNPHVADGATLAISRHAGNPAVPLLVNLAKSAPSSHVRSQALFWLADRAGQQATAAITDAIQNDPDNKVKRQAVFALSRLPNDEGIPKLIELAQTQKNPEVRKQAFFWLGQSHDPRAIAFFESVLSR